MGVTEMGEIASLIARAIKDGGDEKAAATIRSEVIALTAKFPIYAR